MAAADNFDAVFTFDNLYHSYKKCCLGVGWKASTQRYRVNAIANVNDTLRQLKEGKFKSRGFYTFIRVERGKERNIKSVHISERVVQRCLCDYSLIPILSRSFIYDNSACMAGKGIHFAVNRLVCHLQRHYRKYGKNGYALVFDFSKYFDNIEHKPLKDIIDSEYTDTRLAGLVKQLVDDFGDIGLGFRHITALTAWNAISINLKRRWQKWIGRRLLSRLQSVRCVRSQAGLYLGFC